MTPSQSVSCTCLVEEAGGGGGGVKVGRGRRLECGGGEVDGHARKGQRWDSTYQTHDFANSTTLWLSGCQVQLSLPPPSPEATKAELTGETHAVLQQPCSHLLEVLGAVLHCLLTAHTGY